MTTDPNSADLAIVIVNYNTGAYLERCLASLDEHRGDLTTDVLVIDNDSHDGSHTRAVAANPWARLIENPTNVFLSPAWNQGIRATTAPWVLLLNPDTEWWAGTLADYVEAARNQPRAGIVGPVVRNSDGSVYQSGGRSPASPTPWATRSWARRCRGTGSRAATTWKAGTAAPTERWIGSAGVACCSRARRSRRSASSTKGSPLYGEELDLATRLQDVGRTSFYTSAVEIVHEAGVSTGRTRRSLVMHSNSIYRYYARHRADGWRRVTLPFAWCRAPCASRTGMAAGEGEGSMKAVVLVGGEGTRLRPLTETMPKPLLPLMDRRSLDHVLDHLARHGVHEVVLSSPYLESTFEPFIDARRGEPAITWVTEREPLGTGGAIVNALDRLGDEPFFALNGDILTDLDLTAMLALHRERAADVTIALHHVEDARAVRSRRDADPTDGVAGVPGEARAPRCPATSTRGRTCSTPPCWPVAARGRRLDRTRHLPATSSKRDDRSWGSPRTRTGSTWARPRSTCRPIST